MRSSLAGLRTLVAVLALLLARHGVAQTPSEPAESGDFAPKVGQPGKDVIWVPTPDDLVEQMLKMANVGPSDYVIDLGSGDGRTVIAAAKNFRARALGVEYNPDMVTLSKRNAEKAGVADKVDFIEADIFETDFSQATVLTLYLLPSLNIQLRPRILEMRPGTRVVSHSFDMGNWIADEKVTLDGHNAFLWIVPADIAGSWELTVPEDGETWTLELDQDFQMLSGRVHIGNRSFRILEPEMGGASFRFHFVDADSGRRDVVGRAVEDTLEGTVRDQDGNSLTWTAVPEGVRSSRTF